MTETGLDFKALDAKIKPHHHAIPRPLWKKMQLEEEKGTQKKIVGMFQPKKRAEFDQSEVLDLVSKFIACGDQVST